MNWLTDARDIVVALLLVGLNGFFVAAGFAMGVSLGMWHLIAMTKRKRNDIE